MGRDMAERADLLSRAQAVARRLSDAIATRRRDESRTTTHAPSAGPAGDQRETDLRFEAAPGSAAEQAELRALRRELAAELARLARGGTT